MLEGEVPVDTVIPTAPAAAEPTIDFAPDASGTLPSAALETEDLSSGDPAPSDSEDENEDAPTKEDEMKGNLDREVIQVGDTLENRTRNDFTGELTGKDLAQQEQLMRDNPGKQALRSRHLVKSLKQADDADGSFKLSTDSSGATSRYRTTDGKGIVGIIQVHAGADPASDKFTCRVADASGSSDVSMTRAELLDLMYQTDRDVILASYPAEDRPLMEKYYAGLSGKEKDDEHYTALPEAIVQTAERNGIPTTNTLVRAGDRYFAQKPVPTDASPEVIVRITAENAQRAQNLAKLKDLLGENNLATAKQIQSTMELVGITPAALSQTLEDVRISIPLLQKAIENESDGDKKNELKAQLDSLQATADVYTEAQKLLDPNDTEGKHIQKYLDNQQAGACSQDLAKEIIAHMEKGEIDVLVKMVSPEASISATAEEKKKLREAREKQNKILKGLGIAAALAALLIALGISQGAKQ